MDRRKRGIWIYYAFEGSTSYGFIVPFSVVYLQHQGHGLDVVGYTQAAFLFAVVAFEVPAGYVADRLGRRETLAAGNVVTVLVMVGYTYASTTGAWIGLYVLWGMAWSLHSAIGDAWLYDFLEGESESGTFARTSGRGMSVELAVSAVAAVAAGVLYGVDPDAPFYANAALAATGVPLVLSLPEARSDEVRRPSIGAVLEVLRRQLHRPEVRWLVLYAALFNALFSMTRWLEQPALDAVGVPLVGFGILYASFKLVSAGAALSTGWIRSALGPRSFFLLLVPICAVFYGAVAVVPAFVVPVIYLRRALDRISGPIRNQYLNDRLDGVGRATVLSGASMALSLASGLSSAVLGRVAEAAGPTTFLPVAGVAIASLGGVLWLTTAPVRRPSRSTSRQSDRGVGSD